MKDEKSKIKNCEDQEIYFIKDFYGRRRMMRLWKKCLAAVCLMCLFTMVSVLVFSEESRAEESGEFEIQEDVLLAYKGSGALL